MLGQAHPDQAGRVELHAEDVGGDPVQLRVGQPFEPLDVRLIGGQAVRRLLLRGLGVPGVPDRRHGGPVHRLPGQRSLQYQQRDLGAAAQMGQHLRDGPVLVVGPAGELLLAQGPDQRGEPLMGVTQGGDAGVGIVVHGDSVQQQERGAKVNVASPSLRSPLPARGRALGLSP